MELGGRDATDATADDDDDDDNFHAAFGDDIVSLAGGSTHRPESAVTLTNNSRWSAQDLPPRIRVPRHPVDSHPLHSSPLVPSADIAGPLGQRTLAADGGENDDQDGDSSIVQGIDNNFGASGPWLADGTSTEQLTRRTSSFSPAIAYSYLKFLGILVPCILLIASWIRFTVPSLVYGGLCMLFLCSYAFSNDKSVSVEVAATRVAAVESAGMCLAHIVYQLSAAAMHKDPGTLPWSRLFGFEVPATLSVAVRIILPDVLVLLITAATLHARKHVWPKSNAVTAPSRLELRTVKLLSTILALLVLACVTMVALASPNILSFPYMLFMLVECVGWVCTTKLTPLLQYQRAALFLYNVAHLLALYIAQLFYVAESTAEEKVYNHGALFACGLYPFATGGVADETVYAQHAACATGVILFFVTTTLHGRMLAHYFQDRFHSTIFRFPAVGYVKTFGISIWITPRLGMLSRKALPARISAYFVRNAAKIAAAILFVLAISFPSFLTLTILLWSCATLVVNYGWFQVTSVPALIYTECVVILQYVFSIDHAHLEPHTDVGLVARTSTELGLQMLLLFLYSFTSRSWDRAALEEEHRTVFITPIDSSSAGGRALSVGSTIPMEHGDYMTAHSRSEMSRWSKFRNLLTLAWKSLTFVLLKYAYLISLIVLYVCGLQQVNVLNAVFVLFFISFLIFPKLARSGWIYLVLYTQLVIVLQFLWQFSFAKSVSVDYKRLWGLFTSDNLWYQLRYHVVILLFTVLQLNTFNLLRKKGQNGEEDNSSSIFDELGDVESEPDVYDPDDIRNTPMLIRLAKFIWLLETMTYKYNILACYLVFSLVGFLGPVTVFDLLYLAIFFACLVCYQLRAGRLVKWTWPMICIYPALVASACYVFQFDELQSFLTSQLGEAVLRDIGLIPTSGSDLFEYLLQHVAALFLCVYQYRIFNSGKVVPTIFGSCGLISDIFPPFVSSLIDLVKTVCVVHLSKVLILFLFLFSSQRPSLLGVASLLYVLSILPFRKSQTSSRIAMLLWSEFVVLSQLVYQLQIVQNIVKPNARVAAYIGYTLFDYDAPARAMQFEILLVYGLGLHIATKAWKAEIAFTHPDYPPDVCEWPLLSMKTDITSSVPSVSVTSPRTLQRLREIAIQTMPEFALAFNYWVSNFYSIFGFDLCIMVHVVAALARADAVGLLYIFMVAVWLSASKLFAARVWGAYLVLLSSIILIQYFSAIGLPPYLIDNNYTLPWYGWSPAILQAVGLPITPAQLYIIPDFFVFAFSALMFIVFIRTQFDMPVSTLWVDYLRVNSGDFTRRPRSHLNQVKFIWIRHFLWLCIILVFIQATVRISLLRFLFLCISLWYISSGETILLYRRRRQRVWRYLLWSTYGFFFVIIGYNVPAKVLDLHNDDETFWASSLRAAIGVERFSRNPTGSDGMPFSSSRILELFVMASLMIQRRINHSKMLAYTVNYIKRDAEKSWSRAAQFHIRRRLEIRARKEASEEEIRVIRGKVQTSTGKSRHGGEEDWKKVFGRGQDDRGYGVVDRVSTADGAKSEWDIVGEQQDEMARPGTPDLFAAKESHPAAAQPTAQATLRRRNRAPTQENETAESDRSVTEEAQDTGIPPPWTQKSFGRTLLDRLVALVNSLSLEYTDLYATESQVELSLAEQDESPWWALMRGLFYVVCAHTALLAFIAVYANQVYHGDIISTVPTLAVLLVGMAQRPHPNKYFWQFLIVYFEATIIVKYFFQFDFWTFNNETCPEPAIVNSYVLIIGVKKSCGSFFVDVITELVVLLCCVLHRGLMRRLGLWKYFGEIAAEADNDLLMESSLSSEENMRQLEKIVVARDSAAPATVRQSASVQELMAEIDNGDKPEDERMPWRRLWDSIHSLYKRFIDTSNLLGNDYYMGIFVSDIIAFILTAIFWSSFSGDYKNDTNIQFLYTVFSQNTVPPLFAAILTTNFTLIIIDRAIYTSKSLQAKFVMQFVTVCAFTMWIFFVLPPSNNQLISDLPALQLWFFVKCVYWYFSGLQLKSGYPTLRIYNFFMRKYGAVNAYAFLVYRAIPFVWEFRTIIDWTISDTCLDLYNWMKFEDLFANLYLVKSTRVNDRSFGRKFGQRMFPCFKYWLGGLSVVGLIILLWFPLLLLSIPGTTKISPITAFKVSIDIQGFDPFYVQDLPSRFIGNYSDAQFANLKANATYRSLLASYYTAGNLQSVTLQRASMSNWAISPPQKKVLIDYLQDNSTQLSMRFAVELTRNEPGLPGVLRGSFAQALSYQQRQDLVSVVNRTNGTTPANRNATILLPRLYPRFMHAYPNGQVINLAPDSQMFMDCRLRFQSVDTALEPWWEVEDPATLGTPVIDIVSDNVPAISSLSSYGILGLYIAVVFAAGRFIRILITDLTLRIMYEDLPHPDPVLKMCADIILAREFGDFETEETLYWRLITLFRSPEALLEATRFREDTTE